MKLEIREYEEKMNKCVAATEREFSSVRAGRANATILDQVFTSFRGLLAETAQRDDFLFGSLFTYNGHRTLGIGLMFFPLDSLSDQVQDLRSTYADWLDSYTN